MLALALTVLPALPMREVWSVDFPSRSMISYSGATFVSGGRVFYQEPHGEEGGSVGCVDLKTGKTLWRRSNSDERAETLTFADGHLVIRTDREIVEVAPKDGRSLWHMKVERHHLGLFVEGDRLVIEATKGRLVGVDLRTHQIAWTREVGTELSGDAREGVAAVAGGALWAATEKGAVLRVSLSDGKVISLPSPRRDTVRAFVPMGSRLAVCGARTTEAWRLVDGKPIWRRDDLVAGGGIYVARRDELWKAPDQDEHLYRYRAQDGAFVGRPIDLFAPNYDGITPSPLGTGYVMAIYRGLLKLDANGRALALMRTSNPVDALGIGEGVLTRSADRIVFLRPGAEPVVKNATETARRIVSQPTITQRDRYALERIGHAAVPALTEAIPHASKDKRDTLLFLLAFLARPEDTASVYPLADAVQTFNGESYLDNREYREFMERTADPEWLAPRLLPRLRQAKDERTQARLVEYLVRSRSPEVSAELLSRLRSEATSDRVKETIYGGLANGERPDALAEIVRLRATGPFPKIDGKPLPEPTTDVQKVLAAVFDTRMRFYRPRVETLRFGYGPGVSPFKVAGWPSRLRPVRSILPRSWEEGIRLEMPYVRFEPMDRLGTIVRFEKSGREATARIGIMIAPLSGTGYEANLRKIGDEWFVTSMTMTWIS